MEASRQANCEFFLEWQSKYARHKDRYYFSKVNFWRDFFPGTLGDKLASLAPGEQASESFARGGLVTPFHSDKVYRFPKQKLDMEKLAEQGILFRPGRCYPRSFLSSVGFTAQDSRPFRVLENLPEHLVIDINHPLHRFPLTIGGTIVKALPGRSERGGSCNDIAYSLTESGAGLQAVLDDIETEFFLDQPFKRQDEKPDSVFYQDSRLVDHVDSKAQEQIAELYGRFAQPGMKVLDLMASWDSHFAEKTKDLSITGLGLNEEELRKNSMLSRFVTHDLNTSSSLPFEDSAFDLAVCTVSVEYLINPVAVFTEVSRVLKPDAPFILTFSDRWFPPKAIKVWTELHPFERLALATTYFNDSGQFAAIHTESVRGYPRPFTDPHFQQRHEADPVYAVWAYKRSS